VVDFLGVKQFFTQENAEEESNKANKNRAFYASKLSSAIIEAVTDISNHAGKTSETELRRWRNLADQVKEAVTVGPTTDFIPATKEKYTKTRLTQYEKTL
jgi:hypothetical protein